MSSATDATALLAHIRDPQDGTKKTSATMTKARVAAALLETGIASVSALRADLVQQIKYVKVPVSDR